MFDKEQSTSTADPEKRPGQYDIDVAPADGQPSEDAVFGNLESGPNYRGVSLCELWIARRAVLLTETRLVPLAASSS